MDAATVAVSEAYERAFVAIEPDPRNEMMVLVEGFDDRAMATRRWAACRWPPSRGLERTAQSGP